ncbi:MAG: ABC transporter permease [Eubacteriales bacterium]|nr:ABC transporter permease [Eubacteriales bacterium]
MDLFISMFVLALIYSTPIIIASLGALFSERSGVVNIAIEGIMTIGGFVAATVIVFTQDSLGNFSPWLSVLLAGVAGTVFSLIHAVISIDLQGDQTISGTALNMLAPALGIYLCQIIFNQQRTEIFRRGFVKVSVPGLSEIPVLGDLLFKQIYPTFYLAVFLVIFSYVLLWKTPFGLRLRAAGEHPSAVDSLGISVRKLRYTGVLISGFLGGLAGGIMVLTQSTQFTATSIHGMGFIAIAALIFGRWNPWGVLGAGFFFGFSQIFGIYSRDIPLLANIPKEVFQALPYALTVIALLFFSGKDAAPKSVGIPYKAGQ